MPSADSAHDAAALLPADLPWPVPAGHRVELSDGTTTWVRRAGESDGGMPPLLLLHGLTASSSLNWFGAFGPLAAHFDVVAVDLRGHGRGPRSPRSFEIDLMARDCAEVLDRLGIDAAIPVGFSMGGAVAQQMWHDHRERVAGLVLVSTAMRFRMTPLGKRLYGVSPLLAKAARLLPAPVQHALADRAVAQLDDPVTRRWLVEEMAQSSPSGVVRAAHALSRFGSEPWAAEIDVATTVVVAADDRSLSPRNQRALAASIDGAEVVEAAGAHAAVVWEPHTAVPRLVDACRSLAERIS